MTLTERAAKAFEEGSGLEDCEREFRYALAETRNPTPAMIEAGANWLGGAGAGVRAEAVWRAMHDAMMKE